MAKKKDASLSAEEVKNLPRKTLVVIGYIALVGNRFGLKYQEKVTNHVLGEAHLYEVDNKLLKYMGGTPGTMYEVPVSPTGIIYTQAIAVGRWPDTDKCRLWQAESRAEERVFEARKGAAKIADTSEIDQILDRLNYIYQRQVGRHRTQLLAYFVERITR